MQRIIVLALCLASATAFVPASVSRARVTTTGMSVEEVEAPVEAAVEEAAPAPPAFSVQDMAGVAQFPGFFDPLNLADVPEARMMFYREAELKHCRVAMLAALGFIVAEGFHPLFGGSINVPSYVAFQATPLQTFWPMTVLIVGSVEIFSVLTYESPFDGKWWTLKPSHKSGDFMFDPAGLKPTGALELKEMQTKELNNGRLAMLAIAGMVGQELATGAKLF